MSRDSILTRELDIIIEEHLSNLEYLKKPSLPSVLDKPDYMINYDGIMYFIIKAKLKPYENIDWKTLRIIEMVFELKIFYGNNSIVKIIVYNKNEWKDYCIELLENISDGIIDINNLDNIIEHVHSNINNNELWNIERKYINRRNKYLRYLKIEDFEYIEISEKNMENNFELILKRLNINYIKNFGLRNLKNHYLKQDRNLKFYYDFSYNNKLIELKKYKKFRISNLQNLMIKSRLIRYTKFEDNIYNNEDYKLILFLNSDIVGPEYDEDRYLRMLIESGWIVYPYNIINNDNKVMEILRNDS